MSSYQGNGVAVEDGSVRGEHEHEHEHEHGHGHGHVHDNNGPSVCWNILYFVAILVRAIYVLAEGRSPLTPAELPMLAIDLSSDDSMIANVTTQASPAHPNVFADNLNPFHYPVPTWGIDDDTYLPYLLGAVLGVMVALQSAGARFNAHMHHHHLIELPKLLYKKIKAGELSAKAVAVLILLMVFGMMAAFTIVWDVQDTVKHYLRELELPDSALWLINIVISVCMLFAEGYLFCDVLLDILFSVLHGDEAEAHSHLPPFDRPYLLSGLNPMQFQQLSDSMPLTGKLAEKVRALTLGTYLTEKFSPAEVKAIKQHLRNDVALKPLLGLLTNKWKYRLYVFFYFCGVSQFLIMLCRMVNGGFSLANAAIVTLPTSLTAIAEAADLNKITEEEGSKKERKSCCPQNPVAILILCVLNIFAVSYFLFGHILMFLSEFLVFDEEDKLTELRAGSNNSLSTTPAMVAGTNVSTAALMAKSSASDDVVKFIMVLLVCLSVTEVNYHIIYGYFAMFRRFAERCANRCTDTQPKAPTRSVALSVFERKPRSGSGDYAELSPHSSMSRRRSLTDVRVVTAVTREEPSPSEVASC